MSKSSATTVKRRIFLLQMVFLCFVGLLWLRFMNNELSEDSIDKTIPEISHEHEHSPRKKQQEAADISLMEEQAHASKLSSTSSQQQRPAQVDNSQPNKLSDRYKGPFWEVETKYAGPYEVLDDPNEMPPPAFHGCNDRGLCKFSNVCVSGFPNILVPKNNHHEGVNYSWVKSTFGDKRQYQKAYRPRLIEAFPNTTRLHIVDSIFSFSCLGQGRSKYNPAHVMYGLGKLFVAATGHYNFDWGNDGDGEGDDNDKTKSKRTKPLIVYQQCADVDGFPWGSTVEEIIWDYAYSHSFVDVPWKDRNKQRIVLPRVVNADDIVTSTKDHVIFCGRTLQSDVRTATISRFLGHNDAEPVEKWERYINDVIFKDEKSVDKDLRTRQETACRSRNLRIAIWQRSDNPDQVTHNRLFRNMDEIRSLVSNYTEEPLRIMSATVQMPPKEQAMQFRTFDILITPFGAHLTNMLFGHFSRTVYIQASAIHLGPAYHNNEAFSKRFIGSYGHPTWNNPEVEAMRTNCTEMNAWTQGCADAFKSTDITADIELLGSALDEAVETICSNFNNSTTSA